MAQNDSQKAPYEQNATAPNVLPVRNSHRPATNWAMPPYVRARANTTGSPLSETRLALNMLSTNVVSAKPARPRGPGSATGVGTKLTSWRAVVPAVGSAWPSPAGARGGGGEGFLPSSPLVRGRAGGAGGRGGFLV